MRMLLSFGLVLLLACGGTSESTGDTGGSGGSTSFSGCGDIATNCAPTMSCSTVTCPFDASTIDCGNACENLLAVCAGACPGVNCGSAVDMAACMQTCGLETDFSCGNATFGCYTLNTTCTSIAQCLGCSQ